MSPYYREIDPEGDIIISHPTTESKFRLCSRILTLSSPVFRAMFSPRYCEGLALASAVGVVEISLPGDSPRAMAIIFRLLHYQNPEVGKEIENEVLYEMALMAEKYELIGALGRWRETWLQTTARDGRKWLSAVYILSGRKVSNVDCWKAVLDGDGMSGGNDEPMGSILPCDLIPEKVLGMIYLTLYQRSQAASPVRLGFRAAGLGFFCGRPGRTVGYSPAFRAYLTGPGRTADICRLSSDKM